MNAASCNAGRLAYVVIEIGRLQRRRMTGGTDAGAFRILACKFRAGSGFARGGLAGEESEKLAITRAVP